MESQQRIERTADAIFAGFGTAAVADVPRVTMRRRILVPPS
jgi:hypothetical protein